MKKMYFVILLMCVNVCVVFAQTDNDYERYLHIQQQQIRNEENRAYWTIALMGGPVLYQGECDGDVARKDLITAYGKLVVTRWFSSVWGIRAQLDGGILKNNAIWVREPDANGKFSFGDGYLELVTNVMNWGTNKRSNRPFAIYLYGGGGMAWTPSRKTVPSQVSPAALVGGELNVRITDFWSIALELDATIVKDNFNSHSGGRKYEGYTGITAGVVYRFPRRLNK